jgi:DNA-binding response OmpR family regulator
MNKKQILMAEDEENISDFVKRGLEDFDYQVTVASNGKDAWQLIEGGMRPDLLLLDIRMPGMTGLEVCQHVRQLLGFQLPVLMLTALNTTDDIVMGLHVGADDYLVKPFKFMELLARIEALLRRTKVMSESAAVNYAGMSLNPVTHQATRGDLCVDLSIKEYRLLEYLIRHKGEQLSRRQLLKDVWDKDFDTNTNIVDVYVRYLRNKIDDPFEQKLIHTVVGVGYILEQR